MKNRPIAKTSRMAPTKRTVILSHREFMAALRSNETKISESLRTARRNSNLMC